MAAQVKTVKPAGGGDYSTLQTWENAADDSSTKADPWWAECYTGNLAKVNIQTWTDPPTQASEAVKIYAATGEGHGGSFAAACAEITFATAEAGGIMVRVAHIHVTGLRIVASNSGAGAVYCDEGTAGLIFDKLLGENTAGTANSAKGFDFTDWGNNQGVVIKNCISRNFHVGYNVQCTGSTNVAIYNCIAYACDDGGFSWTQAGAGALTLSVENCISMATEDAEEDYKQGNAPSSHVMNNCLSEDSTADNFGGAGHLVSQTIADIFTDAPNGDFTFAADSPAIDAGKNLAGTVDDDIIGTARPQGAAYDMGAYEKAAAGPPSGSLCTLFTGI